MPDTMPQNPESSQATSPDGSLRLQTLMERLGIASRRHAAEIIKAGNVCVNGVRILEPGFRVEDPRHAAITFGGRVYTLPRDGAPSRTIMLNKPRGLICSSSDIHGETVLACLPHNNDRLVCVGRLDRDSDGLLLLSNDGEFVNHLTHPRFGHSKEYQVFVSGPFDQEVFDFLNSPMKMDGYRIRPVQVDYLERLPDGSSGRPCHLLRFTLHEGRNRQIRNMCELAGLRVHALTRTAINGLRLPADLRPGEWRDLAPRDFTALESIRLS